MDNIKKLLQSIENYEKHFKIKAYYMAFALSYDSDDEAEVLVGIASKEQITSLKDYSFMNKTLQFLMQNIQDTQS